MRKLQRLGAVATLLVALSLSVTAGEIHTDAVPPPPPPPPNAVQATAPGDIHTDDAATVLSEIALNLLQLLPLF